MTNIWEVLFQTLTVSLTALLLLLVKRLLEDKLSPRWQYGIWSVLAVRILWPASLAGALIPSLPVWVELGKTLAERGLQSAFSGEFVPVQAEHVVPLLKGMPVSITDWLFAVYCVGVLLFALFYTTSYLRLRLLLRKGEAPGPEVTEQLRRVCEAYGLRGCRTVRVRGLSSAFVCGLVKPVLALPADRMLDDKELLHELLHLRYRDAWQNVGWCLLRCFHWFNPFLHWIFNRIGNDMETLCDQRVLERLQGEERREYGRILLDMANDTYARAPGTTSLSNGGKNIALRIKAIARFRKYPQGMALVSVCIAITLLGPVMIGYGAEVEWTDCRPYDEWQWEQAMARARAYRCTTAAGAIDTYVKGLFLNNGIYLTMSTPQKYHEALAGAMYDREGGEGYRSFLVYPGEELDEVAGCDFGTYQIYNFCRRDEGGYSAVLELRVEAIELEPGSEPGTVEDEWRYDITVQIPIIVYEENGWVVEENGERQRFVVRKGKITDYRDRVPARWETTLESEAGYGTLEAAAWTLHNIPQEPPIFWWGDGRTYIYGSSKLYPHAEFGTVTEQLLLQYRWEPQGGSTGPKGQAAILSTRRPVKDTSELVCKEFCDMSGFSSDGKNWVNRVWSDTWDKTLTCQPTRTLNTQKEKRDLTDYLQVGITWDGELVEVFEIKGVSP